MPLTALNSSVTSLFLKEEEEKEKEKEEKEKKERKKKRKRREKEGEEEEILKTKKKEQRGRGGADRVSAQPQNEPHDSYFGQLSEERVHLLL